MWVSIAEAARRFGVSDDTVRRRIRAGDLDSQQVKGPGGFRWEVWVEDVAPQEPPQFAEASEDVAELVELLREQLTAKDRQIEQLHILLQQAQAALPAPQASKSWWRRLWIR